MPGCFVFPFRCITMLQIQNTLSVPVSLCFCFVNVSRADRTVGMDIILTTINIDDAKSSLFLNAIINTPTILPAEFPPNDVFVLPSKRLWCGTNKAGHVTSVSPEARFGRRTSAGTVSSRRSCPLARVRWRCAAAVYRPARILQQDTTHALVTSFHTHCQFTSQNLLAHRPVFSFLKLVLYTDASLACTWNDF